MIPAQLSGEGRGPTVCEGCMGALAACLTQTMVAHATSRGIQLDSIDIDVEGDVDMRGITGISTNVRPGNNCTYRPQLLFYNCAFSAFYYIGDREDPARSTAKRSDLCLL